MVHPHLGVQDGNSKFLPMLKVSLMAFRKKKNSYRSNEAWATSLMVSRACLSDPYEEFLRADYERVKSSRDDDLSPQTKNFPHSLWINYRAYLLVAYKYENKHSKFLKRSLIKRHLPTSHPYHNCRLPLTPLSVSFLVAVSVLGVPSWNTRRHICKS